MLRAVTEAVIAAADGICALYHRVICAADRPPEEGGQSGKEKVKDESLVQLDELANTEQQIVTTKRCVTVPESVSISSDKAANMAPQSNLVVAAAGANLPVVETPVTQEQKAEGSHIAEQLLEEAKKVVGNTPLSEAAKDHPREAWRVWSSKYKRQYPEDSEEFNERYKIFLRNAEIARKWNADHADNPRKFLSLNNRADKVPCDLVKGGMRKELYTGPVRCGVRNAR